MKFLKYILLLSVVFSGTGIHSQNDSLNRQKYWKFRERLITKFVKPGLGTGESVPAKMYTLGIAWTSQPARLVKKLQWGDATIHLGWYTGVLATEIELLQRSGKTDDVYFKKVVEELFFALSAFNRLDDAAEIVWGYAPPDCDTRIDKVDPVLWDTIHQCWLPKPGTDDKPIRNGFSLRFDGNVNLLEYFTDAASLNTSMVRTWLPWDTSSVKSTGVNGGSFGFYAVDPNERGFEYRANGYYAGNESSQDQIFNQLIGLMLTAEFVDDTIRYEGTSLNAMAREIGIRLIDQYNGTEFRNPVWPKRGVCSAGGNSFAFWQSVKKIKRYLETGKKNNVKDQIFFWGKLSCGTSYTVVRALYVIISALANTTPQQDMCRYSTSDGFSWGIFYLLRRAIYNPKVNPKRGCDYSLEEVKGELGLCPFRGPHFDKYEYGPDENYVVDKTSKERNFREYSKQEIIDNRVPIWHFSNRFYQICSPESATQKRFIVEQGEFNGLDYMLLYNLANIVFGVDAMGGNYTGTRDMYFSAENMFIK